MSKHFIVALFFCISVISFAQINSPINRGVNGISLTDSIKIDSARFRPGDSLNIFIPTIKDYVFWTDENQNLQEIDTTFNLKKLYNQNFLQRDYFGDMPFPNIGQTLNPLEFRSNESIKFQILPYGKSQNYLLNEDVKYFDVKTPITELVYENGVREGNYLSTTFSHSPNKQFNYSVRYRGLRSLGRYQEQLASNNALVLGFSYKNKSERFKLWMNYTGQNIDNEENGGVSELEDFKDRDVSGGVESLGVNLTDISSELDSRRLFNGMSYGLLKKTNPSDSTTYHPLTLRNRIYYEKQTYTLIDAGNSATNALNDTFIASPVFDGILDRRSRKVSESTKNKTTVAFNWTEKLNLEAGVQYENLKVSSDSALVNGLVNIPSGFRDDLFSILGKAKFDWNERIKLTGDAIFTSGDFLGTSYNVNANLKFTPINGYNITGAIQLQSAYPSLSLVYNQSYYKDFNYFNQNFNNQEIQKLYGKIESEKFRTSIEAEAFNIDNYAYIDAENNPRQFTNALNVFKLRLNHHSRYKNYHLNANLQYQEVSNETVLPLPQYFGRLSLYYQNHAFKRAAQVQLGFNFNYFAKFKSREFSPILNEFKLSNETDQEIGAFPLLDFFASMKVKRMQIFIRADHLFGAFGDRNYFSTPNIPYRIFKFQFGITWYLFT